MTAAAKNSFDAEHARRDGRLRDWVRSCLSKVNYRSQARAQRAIRRLQAKRKVQLRAYQCNHCCGWHLTKQVCR